MNRPAMIFVFVLALLLTLHPAQAAVPIPGNILVGDPDEKLIMEYTPEGELVQSISIPLPENCDAFMEITDIVTDPRSRIFVMTRVRNIETRERLACIAVYDSGAAQWSYHFVQGLERATYGYVRDLDWIDGRLVVLSAKRSAMLLDDNLTTGVSAPSGTSMAVDSKGHYYVASGERGRDRFIYVYENVDDPSPVRKVPIPDPGPSSIAVADDGSIYLGNFGNRSVTRVSATGELLGELTSEQWGNTSVMDIDLLPDGRLVVGTRFDVFIVVNGDLNQTSLQSFEVPEDADQFFGVVVSKQADPVKQALPIEDQADPQSSTITSPPSPSTDAESDEPSNTGDKTKGSSNTILIVIVGLLVLLTLGVIRLAMRKK